MRKILTDNFFWFDHLVWNFIINIEMIWCVLIVPKSPFSFTLWARRFSGSERVGTYRRPAVNYDARGWHRMLKNGTTWQLLADVIGREWRRFKNIILLKWGDREVYGFSVWMLPLFMIHARIIANNKTPFYHLVGPRVKGGEMTLSTFQKVTTGAYPVLKIQPNHQEWYTLTRAFHYEMPRMW